MVIVGTGQASVVLPVAGGAGARGRRAAVAEVVGEDVLVHQSVGLRLAAGRRGHPREGAAGCEIAGGDAHDVGARLVGAEAVQPLLVEAGVVRHAGRPVGCRGVAGDDGLDGGELKSTRSSMTTPGIPASPGSCVPSPSASSHTVSPSSRTACCGQTAMPSSVVEQVAANQKLRFDMSRPMIFTVQAPAGSAGALTTWSESFGLVADWEAIRNCSHSRLPEGCRRGRRRRWGR